MYINFIRACAVGGCGGVGQRLTVIKIFSVRGHPLALMFTVGRCVSNR